MPDDDGLVWSSGLARMLPLEAGDVVEVARFSRLRPGATNIPDWEPYVVLSGNRRTEYRPVEMDGQVVLGADAPEGGSGLFRKIHIDLRRHPVMEFRWRVPRSAGSASGASRLSPPVRVSVAVDGDPARLEVEDRVKLRLAKALTVHGLPYASLLYVWLNSGEVESVVHSPHTDRVRMIVVESGEAHLDQWISIRRNVLEDYRRAFGEEPGHIVAIGLMTDVGDDGSRRSAFYGDITFRSLE